MTPRQRLRVLRLRARLHEIDREISRRKEIDTSRPALEVGRIYVQQELALEVRRR
jgi:hypothetical protein